MNILLFLIPVSMVLLLVAVWAFRWAVRKGQFENLDAAAIDILRDDSTDAAPGTADGGLPGTDTVESGPSPVDAGKPGRTPGGGAHAD